MNKKDFYTGLIFLLFAGAIFVLILRSRTTGEFSGPGPFFFPGVAALLLGGLALTLLIQGVRSTEGGGEKAQGKQMFGRILWIVAWSVIYGATIEKLGYLLSTGLVTFALLAYFNRGWVFNIVFTLVSPVSIYILFDTLLKAPLPKGILGP
jgi:putative tricarboxylic transport membrane protein